MIFFGSDISAVGEISTQSSQYIYYKSQKFSAAFISLQKL